MIVLDNDTENYVNRFKDVTFSANDFLKMFVLIYSSQKKIEFNYRVLVNYISECKKKNNFGRVLNSIDIINNGIFNYSNELEEEISRLKFASILYTDTSSDPEMIYIFEGINLTEFIKMKGEYYDEMCDFVRSYDISLDSSNNSKLVLQNN